MVTPEDRARKYLVDYKKYKVSAAQALDLLKTKSLAEGVWYYVGVNTRDGWVEIFKTSKGALAALEEVGKPIAKELTADEIEAFLKEKNLYFFASKGGWVTIRRVPKGADDEERLPTVRSPDEN